MPTETEVAPVLQTCGERESDVVVFDLHVRLGSPSEPKWLPSPNHQSNGEVAPLRPAASRTRK